MKVLGLDGREYHLNLADYCRRGDDDRPRSHGHLLARILLRGYYPCDQLLEEVPLYGCGTVLYLDFFLPLRRIAVEVQGEQHYQQVKHFHPTRMDYLRARGRDVQKRQWCSLNGISLVELPYGETEDDWRNRILAAHTA